MTMPRLIDPGIARRVQVELDYLAKFQMIFGRDPSPDELAKFNVIVNAHRETSEASLMLALETWLLNGPRIDHCAPQ